MRRKRYAIGACLAAIIAAASVTMAAGLGFSLPGINNDAQNEASQSGRTISASVQASGIELTVNGVVADSTQVLLSVALDGAPELGGYPAFGVASLVDAHGTELALQRSVTDRKTGRTVSLTFPGTLKGDGTWRLTVESLDFPSPAIAGPVTRDTSPAAPTHTVTGPWVIEFTPGVKVIDARSVAPVSPAAVFGVGRAVVDRVLMAPSGTVVQGHLEGFSPEQIAVVHLVPSITTATGNDLKLVGGRSGYGEGMAQFEFRFPVISKGIAVFTLEPMVATSSPTFESMQESDQQALLKASSQTATWDINTGS